MKKFYDRQQEMELLENLQAQAYEDYSRFVVLTGRRRVGKTSLVYRLMQKTSKQSPGLYFFVGRKAEAMLVKNFCDEAREKLGEFIPDEVNTFRGLFQMLLEVGKRRKFTIFIDEFQEFENTNPGIFSDIQELWDRYKKETHVCLIVSGSIFRMMEKIFKDEGEPLFGRDDCTIKLKPFSTDTIRQILSDYKKNYTNEDLLALWTITGGVARYIELLMNNHCTDIKKMLHYVCSNGDSFFIDEGKNILVQEFGKQYGTYFSILEQIAFGNVTLASIEGSLGIRSLGGQLKILEEKYGFIQKKRPIGAKSSSQTVRYEIQDNFFRFWFRYIHHNFDLIEIQNMNALEKIIADDYKTFSGIALERWFRKKMAESSNYKQIGGWWQANGINSKGNNDEFEIDIVAETLDGQVEAIEVKRNPKKYNYARLKEKVSEMQHHLYRSNDVKIIGLSME
ncbi:MAG: AAA family ATPase, partial [Fibrobacteraceae bacterium]|nr:AAA family ATPase [Fibrobacteraceae bacterium]